MAEAGITVIGNDLSESGIAQSQRRGIEKFRLSSIYDPLAVPFGRQAFDAIVYVEVIEHLYSPATVAAVAMQALRPRGLS